MLNKQTLLVLYIHWNMVGRMVWDFPPVMNFFVLVDCGWMGCGVNGSNGWMGAGWYVCM